MKTRAKATMRAMLASLCCGMAFAGGAEAGQYVRNLEPVRAMTKPRNFPSNIRTPATVSGLRPPDSCMTSAPSGDVIAIGGWCDDDGYCTDGGAGGSDGGFSYDAGRVVMENDPGNGEPEKLEKVVITVSRSTDPFTTVCYGNECEVYRANPEIVQTGLRDWFVEKLLPPLKVSACSGLAFAVTDADKEALGNTTSLDEDDDRKQAAQALFNQYRNRMAGISGAIRSLILAGKPFEMTIIYSDSGSEAWLVNPISSAAVTNPVKASLIKGTGTSRCPVNTAPTPQPGGTSCVGTGGANLDRSEKY